MVDRALIPADSSGSAPEGLGAAKGLVAWEASPGALRSSREPTEALAGERMIARQRAKVDLVV
jgi:hypothetical protein